MKEGFIILADIEGVLINSCGKKLCVHGNLFSAFQKSHSFLVWPQSRFKRNKHDASPHTCLYGDSSGGV